MKHDNDYSVTAFLSNKKAVKYKFVHKLDGFAIFLNQKHSEWVYMNVYDRHTGEYLKRFYRGNSIPSFI
jgi:hypothetical protein